MVTIIFQISNARAIISVLIRVISGLKVNFNYLWDLDEIFLLNNWRMANAMVTIIFQISDATPIISLLIRVISGLMVNFIYLWDLDEMSYTKQLKDGECNGDNYILSFCCHAYN